MNAPHYTAADLDYLRANYLTDSPAALMERLPGRSWLAIKNKACRMKIATRTAGMPSHHGPLPAVVPVERKPRQKQPKPERPARIAKPPKPTAMRSNSAATPKLSAQKAEAARSQAARRAEVLYTADEIKALGRDSWQYKASLKGGDAEVRRQAAARKIAIKTAAA